MHKDSTGSKYFKPEKSRYVGIFSPSIGLFLFVVEWINIALILINLNRKVSVCRDFLSLYRCTGGASRLHEVTISICSQNE